MDDSGLRYWLDWPHTKRGWVVSTALFAGATVVAIATGLLYASVAGAIITVRFGWKALTWDERTDGTVPVADGSDADGTDLGDGAE